MKNLTKNGLGSYKKYINNSSCNHLSKCHAPREAGTPLRDGVRGVRCPDAHRTCAGTSVSTTMYETLRSWREAPLSQGDISIFF
jgi:hypothetical protein